ncbi:hypothetical protein [uncultured Dokdonia sp.]|uniref:hypothetical protein n=1 Tax=uncultured Dokdonia sp. TaxID=575653 RepID=UPI002621627A|nr:hypothetical protein [uncultured Dokdonia sp.]
MNKLFKEYVKINFSGQTIGNPYSAEVGTLNIITFEVSLVTGGFLMGLLFGIGMNEAFIIIGIMFVYIFLIWKYLKRKLSQMIDFDLIKRETDKYSRLKTITNFILTILFLALCSFSQFISIKLIISLLS